jgi:NAD(P)-dependent dehydrogenase (short-subunit alcohol dehydrogenase family)
MLNEQAYADKAKSVPIGRAGRPEEIASVVLWLAARVRATWSGMRSRLMVE